MKIINSLFLLIFTATGIINAMQPGVGKKEAGLSSLKRPFSVFDEMAKTRDAVIKLNKEVQELKDEVADLKKP